VAILALTASAYANSPEPSPATFAAVIQTCTADGAFGYRFGEHGVSAHATGLPPFVIATLSQNREGLFEIIAAASFAKAPMSGEDRIALTNWVFEKLDSGVAARKFVHRQKRRDGIAYIASAFVLDLSHDGTTVRIACTDIARKKPAWSERRGRQTP
jgi:hypothetical protein